MSLINWIWLIGLRCVALWSLVGWACGIWENLTKFRLVNGCGGTVWRQASFGGGLCTNEVTATYGVSLWRSIRQGWPAFFKSTIFKVGNGNRIKVLNFGITCSVRVVLFRRHFQNFIALVVIRILILRMSCPFPNRRLHCDLRFYREPQDWEMEQFDIFWNLTHSMTFTSEGHDKLC